MHIYSTYSHTHTHVYLEMKRPPSEFLWEIGFKETHLMKTKLGVPVGKKTMLSVTPKKGAIPWQSNVATTNPLCLTPCSHHLGVAR